MKVLHKYLNCALKTILISSGILATGIPWDVDRVGGKGATYGEFSRTFYHMKSGWLLFSFHFVQALGTLQSHSTIQIGE